MTDIDPNNCYELVEHYVLPNGDIDPQRDILTRHGSREAAAAAGQAVLVERPNAFVQVVWIKDGLCEPVFCPELDA